MLLDDLLPATNQYLSVFLLTLILCTVRPMPAQTKPASGESWKFAVSGDSRNCGDIVMPAIAQGVRQDGAAFYWHLGDYRAIYTFDEDWRQLHPNGTVSDYLTGAWPDFIQHQLNAVRRPAGLS